MRHWYFTLLKAQEIADKVLDDVDRHTRNIDRKIVSVEYVKESENTRGNNDESNLNLLFYLINYADNKGYALVSADDRMQPVYAFSPEGNMNLADTTYNLGLRMYFASLPKSLPINTRVDPPITQMQLTVMVSPLVAKFVRKWDPYQFKYYVNPSPFTRIPVGCVAVSPAYILTVLEYPNSLTFKKYNNSIEDIIVTFNLDWDKINDSVYYYGTEDTETSRVDRLMGLIGRSKAFNITYSDSETGSTANFFSRVIPAYYNLGIAGVQRSGYFDESLANNCLRSHLPIQVSGSDPINGYNHCWVIDGLAKSVSLSLVGQSEYVSYYYHFVWGNSDGYNNGYYYFNSNSDVLGDRYFEGGSSGHENDEEGNSIGSFWNNLNSAYFHKHYIIEPAIFD